MSPATSVASHPSFMRLHGLRMADAGYSIVPLAAGEKFPAEYSNGRYWPMKGWEFNALTKTPEVLIENVWSNWPGCGIGICCGGQSRVIGVDIDVMDAEIAGAIRRKVEEMLGVTPLVRVGQAPKVMLLYRTTQSMRKITRTPIEVLGEGNQLVGWGVHPKTGLPYTWTDESPAETPVESLPLVTPEQVQAAIDEAFKLVPEELRPARLSEDTGSPHSSSSDTASATPEAIREALAHIPNPDVDWAEWKRVLMATFAASHGDEGAYFELLTWSRRSAKHSDEATRREWTSCRSSPPRSLGFGTLHYLATQNGWVPTAGLAFNTAKDVSDVDISGFDAMPFAEVAAIEVPNPQPLAADCLPQQLSLPTQSYPLPGASPGVLTLSPDSSERLLEVEWEGSYSDTQPRRYLVKKLLPLEGLALLSGPSGAGKSFVGIDLAGAVATGTMFFGKKVTPGGTLVLASEGYGTLKDRLISYRSGKYALDRLIDGFAGMQRPYIPNFPIGIAPIHEISQTNLPEIITECRSFGQDCLERFRVPLRLVIVDTFAAAFSLQDENSSSQVTAALKLLQQMADELGVLVMPVVHHGKSEGGGVRGSSAFEASADARLTVHYAKDADGQVSGRTISLGKSRTDETGWIHNFALEPHVLGIDEDGDEIGSCTVSDLGPPKDEERPSRKAETSKRRDALIKAIDAAAGSYANVEGWIEQQVIRDLFAKSEGEPDQTPEAARKMFERAVADAEKSGELEIMGSRGEKKLRKKARTLDKDPPKGGVLYVH